MLSHIFCIEQSPLPRINNIGCSADPANNRFGPGTRNIYLIHYVFSGKGYYNGHPVTGGQGFLIRQGQPEEYHPDKEDPWEFLWVTSDDEAIGKLFDKYNADPHTSIFCYGDTSVVKSTAQFIRNNHNRAMTAAEILECFLHIFNSHAHRFESRLSNADVYFAFSLNYIKSNLHTSLEIRDLVAALGISHTYLLRLFKKRTGRSPKAYINALRMNNAKRMLSETNATVTQIANSNGYTDVMAFSRFFASREKLSPTQYRKRAGMQSSVPSAQDAEYIK